MEVMMYKTKVASGMRMHPLAFLAMFIILLLNTCCCSASVIVKSNNSFRCSGRLDECLLEEELDLEYLMNPYMMNRMLAGAHYPMPKPDVPGQPAITCGQQQDPQYAVCIAEIKKDYHLCVKGSIFSRCP